MSDLTFSGQFNGLTLGKLPTEKRDKLEGAKIEVVPLSGPYRGKEAKTTLFR